MKNSINLLLTTATPLTFWQKFYVWALTIGRYIIIFTELIVLVAFFYKFKLDNDLASLQSQFKQNIGIMQANASQATVIKEYQARAVAEQQIFATQHKQYGIVSHTFSLFPSGINIMNADFSETGAITISGNIQGVGNTQLALIQGINNTLRTDPLYTNVVFSNITSNTATNTTNFLASMSVRK